MLDDNSRDHMKDAFDDMAAHFEGAGNTYDADFYYRISSCMNSNNDLKLSAS